MVRYTQDAVTNYGEDAANIVSEHIRQTYNDTCAIKSQQLILESFGIDISEDQLRNEAMQHGWYSPGSGTNMYDVGNLLELHGIDVQQYEHCNIYNLVNELAQGRQVIIGVDSGELWNNDFYENEDQIMGEYADHALVVSGIDTTDPNHVKVIVTDPGTGDYCKAYPMEQFVNAANDSNFFMVTTVEPVPHIFDPLGNDITHLPMIGNMTYDYFVDNYAFLQDIENRPVFEKFTQILSGSDFELGSNNDIPANAEIDLYSDADDSYFHEDRDADNEYDTEYCDEDNFIE
jgi:hypothetical protein